VLWAAVIGWVLFHVPFELRETTGNLTDFMTAPPAYSIFVDTFSRGAWPAPGFLRTFSLATSKLVFELSGGAYFDTYRGLHAAMILFLMVMLMRLLRVDSTVMLGVAVLAGIAFVGMPTLHEAVRETELNIKLVIPASVSRRSACQSRRRDAGRTWRRCSSPSMRFSRTSSGCCCGWDS